MGFLFYLGFLFPVFFFHFSSSFSCRSVLLFFFCGLSPFGRRPMARIGRLVFHLKRNLICAALAQNDEAGPGRRFDSLS